MKAERFESMAHRDTSLGSHVWDDKGLKGPIDTLADLELDAEAAGGILAAIGREGKVAILLIGRAAAHDGNVGGDVEELERDRRLDPDCKDGHASFNVEDVACFFRLELARVLDGEGCRSSEKSIAAHTFGEAIYWKGKTREVSGR